MIPRQLIEHVLNLRITLLAVHLLGQIYEISPQEFAFLPPSPQTPISKDTHLIIVQLLVDVLRALILISDSKGQTTKDRKSAVQAGRVSLVFSIQPLEQVSTGLAILKSSFLA